MSRPFPFDLNIDRAATLPARMYVDPVVLALEEDRVFGRTWQLVGHTAAVQTPGAYFTAEVAGQSIVVVRDGETLRAFHNVCLHRAGPVATGCGLRHTLQCKYHGWTYGLDGALLRTPGMEDARNFAAEEMHLVPVQVEAWGPLVFANLDLKAPPLSHFVDDLPSLVNFDPAVSYACVDRREYEVTCNWKVYVDNYLEGYHIPVVHPALHKELDSAKYRVEPKRYYSIQHAPLRGASAADVERLYTPDAANDAAQYYWLFPNMMLNVYFGQLQTNLVVPRGVDHTTVVFEWFTLDTSADPASDAWARRVAFSEMVQEEDREICEVVHRNLRSRVYDRGRYAPRFEQGVHHFHALLHEFLT
ncbi:MAG: (2Fe-2S) ferredoxin [Acidimicrobiia bacterium]